MASSKPHIHVEWADAGPIPPPKIRDLVRLAERVLRAELPALVVKSSGTQTKSGKAAIAKATTGKSTAANTSAAKTAIAKTAARTVNLVFCDNAYIRDLNKRFRKLDKATDVLSFIYDDEEVFGEIYIATLKAQKQAPRWKNSFYDELRRLVVHGSLHLAGFDHMNAKDRKAMRAREDLYLDP